jgi:hypothetical protein
MLVGRDYPTGLEHVRSNAKRAFFQNRDVTDELEVLHPRLMLLIYYPSPDSGRSKSA